MKIWSHQIPEVNYKPHIIHCVHSTPHDTCWCHQCWVGHTKQDLCVTQTVDRKQTIHALYWNQAPHSRRLISREDSLNPKLWRSKTDAHRKNHGDLVQIIETIVYDVALRCCDADSHIQKISPRQSLQNRYWGSDHFATAASIFNARTMYNGSRLQQQLSDVSATKPCRNLYEHVQMACQKKAEHWKEPW